MSRATPNDSLDPPPYLLAAEAIDFESRRIHYATRGEAGPWMLTYTLGSPKELYLPAMLDSISQSARIMLVRWPDTTDYDAAIRSGVAVMDHVEVDSAVWYGSSVGGALAQGANALHPERVAGLVLANTALPVPWARGLLHMTRGLVSLVPERLIKKRLLRSLDDLTDAGQAERAAGMLAKKDILNWLHWAGGFHGSKLEQAERRGPQKPTLIIESDDDPGVPARHRRRLLEGYPHASRVTFKNGGHFPQLRFGQDYLEAILAFLRQQC